MFVRGNDETVATALHGRVPCPVAMGPGPGPAVTITDGGREAWAAIEAARASPRTGP